MLLFVFVYLCGFINLSTGSSLVLVGGGLSDDNAAIWNKIIELGGGSGVARIGIVTAASADPQDSADYYHGMFQQYGALETYWIPVHEANKEANSDPDVVDNIRRMTGFFYGGGSQGRIINSFYDWDIDGNRIESPAMTAIRETHEAGAVSGGTSAGAVCQGKTVMIMGGMSYESLLSGSHMKNESAGVDDLVYDEEGGVGAFDNYVIDSHVGERGREGRLTRLVSDTMMQENGGQFGLGLDEDTAFVITGLGTPNPVGEVIGPAGVILLDLRDSSVDDNFNCWRIINVWATFLTEGDTIDLNTDQVTIASWKLNLAGDEYYDYALTSDDIFNGNRASPSNDPEFTRVSRSLFDSRLDVNTLGITSEKNPEFQVFFRQESGSVGYGGYSPSTGTWRISYEKLNVAMRPKDGDEDNNKCS